MTPYFSICIPQYNRTSFLIEACRHLSEQTFRPFEICISDDQSTDGRAGDLETFLKTTGLPFTYRARSSNGRYDANLRSAIALAQGRYCLLMGNDDCLASPTTLQELHDRLETAGGATVALTDFEDYATGKVTHRVRSAGRLAGNVKVAVECFRDFSFVSGVIFDRARAQAAATERCDGSEMYQMYLASKLLAEGGFFLGCDFSAVRKDIQLPGESVDSYAHNPKIDPCPVIERRLPLSRIVGVVASAVGAHQSPEEQKASTFSIAQQILFFTYTYWIFEYRRVQSWRYALGVGLGMRTKNLLHGVTVGPVRRARLAMLHAAVTLVALCLPLRLFQAFHSRLYRMAKGAKSHVL